MKVFKRRDTATAALRKLGIAQEEYDKYIVAVEDGVGVDLEAAASSLEQQPA